jgi:hypothetical protein
MSISRERRRDHRATVDWAALIQTTKGRAVVEMENISANGALIRCHVVLMPSETFGLCMMIPNHSPINARAEVAWLRVNCSQNGTPPCGIGIRFTDFSNNEQQVLRDFTTDSLLFT